MKKLAFLFVAAAAMTMVSCGGNTQATEETGDTTTVEVAAEEAVTEEPVCEGETPACEGEAPACEGEAAPEAAAPQAE